MVFDNDNSSNIFSMNTSTILGKGGSFRNIRSNAFDNDDDDNVNEDIKGDKEFVITELSHDEVDLKIQFSRVMYVLKRTIEKVKVVSYLPTLIEDDGKLLRQYIDEESVQFILDVCEKDAVLCDNIGQRLITLRMKDTSPAILRNTKMDQSMVEVISILYNNKIIKKEVIESEDIVFSAGAVKLIDSFSVLYSVCEQKLQLSASEEKARQQQLRTAWRNNLLVKKDIQTLQKKLIEQRDTFAKGVYTKRKMIDQYQHKIDLVREKFKEKLNNRVAESEKLMGLEAAASEAKITNLTAEVKIVQVEYQALLESHIAYEKNLRAKRLKVETQLATWLAKYDQDIGERFYEIEDLTKQYDEKKAEMDTLQQLFDEQEDEYDELMDEKETEDRRLMEIRMYRILSNVAARKIQRAWKRYWARKQARIKARKERAREKKLGIGAPKKGGKKKKEPPGEAKLRRESNAVDDLEQMFGKSNVLADLTTTTGFDATPVTVEL